jgi:hypothetical protein
MTDTLTVAEKLNEVGFSEVQAAALMGAIEAAATAKAKLAGPLNKDPAAVIERSDARFEQTNAKFEAAIERTVREETRWLATIVFSRIGVLIALLGLALHFRQAKVAQK